MQSNDSWDQFYLEYGRAVFTAQNLERNLATALWFFEARKRAVVKRPTPVEIDKMIDDFDKDTIGELINRLVDFQCFEPHEEASLRLANSNRKTLVHHFILQFADILQSQDGAETACEQVRHLTGPIFEANTLAYDLAAAEIQRMQGELKR